MLEKEHPRPVIKGAGSGVFPNNKIDLVVYKGEPSVLHDKSLFFLRKKLAKLGLPPFAILPPPDTNMTLSSMLHLNKGEIYILLKELAALGFIEIVNRHGIRLLKTMKGGTNGA